jgi:hypothetical protein
MLNREADLGWIFSPENPVVFTKTREMKKAFSY